MIKICAYVQGKYAKQTYSNENFNVRQWVGLQVIIDSLTRSGYQVEYAGAATAYKYDIVLVSITSDCDWWGFIAERMQWPSGDYTVIVGGAGVLNVRPFLPFADCFILGRGENLILDIVREIQDGGKYKDPSVIWADQFSMDSRYTIRQEDIYPHEVMLTNGKTFNEHAMGCNHKCLFCGYAYQRHSVGNDEGFSSGSGLWTGEQINRESALLDMHKSGNYDLKYLRITAIDGMSERLRKMVKKPISNEILQELFERMATFDKPHQLKIYNIIGYPSETQDDWMEFLEILQRADAKLVPSKQWSIVLHCTPFRAMPATPAACWPMSYINYRGQIAKVLGNGKYKGNIFYQGNRFWAVEGMGTDSLSTVILSAIAHRGVEADSDNIRKISLSHKFWHANSAVRQATLEKYFDVQALFGAFTADTLPTRNIGTYLPIERAWG